MIKRLFSIIIVLTLLVSFSACSVLTKKEQKEAINTEAIATISADGFLVVNGIKTKTKIEGLKGKDGLTPYIGVNSNWWVGTIDTNVKASGETISTEEINAIVDAKLAALNNVTVIDGTPLNVFPSTAFDWFLVSGEKIHIDKFNGTVSNINYENFSHDIGRDPFTGYQPYKVHIVLSGSTDPILASRQIYVYFSNGSDMSTLLITPDSSGNFISEGDMFAWYPLSKLYIWNFYLVTGMFQ
jgi:hypothetical protein